METNGYRLLLPEGTLDYFNISDVKMCIRDSLFRFPSEILKGALVCIDGELRVERAKMCIRDRPVLQ